ncbi:hypothetical protein HYW84_02515 [Candidatus Peregrinibacteria bacterium]|nr:hypothetical protein [Candidatus Peregrinibacteria bacterium]
MRPRFVQCRKFFFHMPLNNAPETANCEHAPRGVARKPLTQYDLDCKKWMEGWLSQDPRSSLYRHPDEDETDGMEMLQKRPWDDAGPQNSHNRKGAARRWYRARQPDDKSARKAWMSAGKRERRQHGGGKYFPARDGSVTSETDEQRLRALYADEIAAKGPTVAAYGINATQEDFRLQMNNAILPLQAIALLSSAELRMLDGSGNKKELLALLTCAKSGCMQRLMLDAEK